MFYITDIEPSDPATEIFSCSFLAFNYGVRCPSYRIRYDTIFVVLREVLVKFEAFCDLMPYRLVNSYRSFGEAY
jgi:hypothetical protein